MRLGEIDIEPIIDGSVRFPPSAVFRGTGDADWEPHRSLLDEKGMLELAMGGFLVRTGDRLA